jgi:hypothetical protein
MRTRRTVLCAAFCLAALPVGLCGAAAFNPDIGSLHRNETLWRIPNGHTVKSRRMMHVVCTAEELADPTEFPHC